jgi:hypothetical protein
MPVPKGTRIGGRQKGTPNKTTKALKDMILQALDDAGGIGYLRRQADRNPPAFMTLVGKILPQDIKARHSGEPTLAVLIEESMKSRKD